MCDGILALRYRDGLDRAVPATPGEPYEVRIALGPTANRFRVGHRIRLEVSSSNFPRFARNPNNGTRPTQARESDLTTARQQPAGKAAPVVKTVGRDVIEPWLSAPTRAAAAPAPTPVVNGYVEHKPEAAVAQAVRPLEDLERDAIVQALRRFNGHRQKTAVALGIGVRTLGLKLKKWKEMKLVAETL